MKKVISILTNNFKHDSRVLKQCTTLCRAGYDVTVVALHDDGLAEKETLPEGIKVHRIVLRTRSWSKNRIIQLFKYAEFFLKIVKHYRHVDIIHCNDSEPLPIGVFIKKIFNRKVKVVYDAHELEWDKKEAGSNFYPQWASALAERVFIKGANSMITVSPFIAKAYSERFNIPFPALVMNCPPYKEALQPTDVFRKKFNLRDDHIIFLYQGAFIAHRGIEIILETFQQIDNQYVAVFMGYGRFVPMVQEVAAKSTNIFYHDAVTPKELHHYTAGADFGFCLYQGDSGNHNLTIGNKIFEYIMSGLPVIASNYEGLKLILKKGMGIVVKDHDSVDAIKKAIFEISQWKREDYIESLREAAKKYNWEEQEKVLLEVYQNLYEN